MATLEYDFRVIGTDAVRRAFATLEQRARQHNRNMSAIFGTPKGVGGAATAGGMSLAQRRREVAQLEQAELNSINRIANARINADKRVAASRAQLRRQEEAQDVARERRASTRNRMVNAGVGAVVGAGRVAAGAATLAGMGLATGIYAEGKLASRIATKLVAQSRMAGNKESFADILKGVHGAAQAASLSVGGDRSDVLAAMAAFHSKTGAIGAARNLSLFMARAAEATGASYEDLGTVAGQVYANMMDKQSDTPENRKAAEEAARGFISAAAAQGAERMIELPQLAKYGSRLTGAANLMGGGANAYAKNLALGLAVAQAAPSGTSTTAAESTMAVTRLIQSAAMKGEDFEKDFGFKVRRIENGVPKLLPVEDILPQIVAAMHADPVAAKKYGMEMRGVRGFEGLTSLYERGVQFGDKRLSIQQRGALEIRKYFLDALKKSIPEEEFAKNVEARNKLDPFRALEVAINNLINNAITPFGNAIARLAKWVSENEATLLKLVQGFTNLATTILEHPWRAALLGIGTLIAKDIAAIGIGNVIKNAILSAMGLGGGGGVPPGAPGAPKGLGSKLGIPSSIRGGTLYQEAAPAVTTPQYKAEVAARNKAHARASGIGLEPSTGMKVGNAIMMYGPLADALLTPFLVSEEERARGGESYTASAKLLSKLFGQSPEEHAEIERKKNEQLQRFMQNPLGSIKSGASKAWQYLRGGTEVPSSWTLGPLGANAPSAKSASQATAALDTFTTKLNAASTLLGNLDLNRGDSPQKPKTSSGNRGA